MASSGDTDLFGGTVESGSGGRSRRKSRRVVNDMAAVESVLAVACDEGGYAVAGVAHRVYRVRSGGELEPVPAVDADTVAQLIEAGWLTVGGQHEYCWRNHREGYGHSVLVPRKTRDTWARWKNLTRPEGWAMQTRRGEQGR